MAQRVVFEGGGHDLPKVYSSEVVNDLCPNQAEKRKSPATHFQFANDSG
jgi:hypothetical protein